MENPKPKIWIIGMYNTKSADVFSSPFWLTDFLSPPSETFNFPILGKFWTPHFEESSLNTR